MAQGRYAQVLGRNVLTFAGVIGPHRTVAQWSRSASQAIWDQVLTEIEITRIAVVPDLLKGKDALMAGIHLASCVELVSGKIWSLPLMSGFVLVDRT